MSMNLNIPVNINLKLVKSVEEATHILALKDYGIIGRGDLVEIHDYSGMRYVYDIDVLGFTRENAILDEWEENLLYKLDIKIEGNKWLD